MGADNSSTNRPSEPTSTNASRQPASNTARRNGRLSSSSFANTTPSNSSSGIDVDGVDPLRMPRPLTCRHLDSHVPQRVAALGSGGEYRSGERAGSGTGIDDGEDVRSPDPLPFGVEVPRDDRPEQRPDLGRRDEVAAPTGRSPIRLRVEPLGPVERQVHEPLERNRPLRPNRVANLVSHSTRTSRDRKWGAQGAQRGSCLRAATSLRNAAIAASGPASRRRRR